MQSYLHRNTNLNLVQLHHTNQSAGYAYENVKLFTAKKKITPKICTFNRYTPTGPNSFEIYFKARVPNFDAAGTYTMQRGFFGANRPAAGPFSYTMSKSTATVSDMDLWPHKRESH